MAAPKGNRFWEVRSKHGRDKAFESPEILWEAACEYFEWCEDNPLMAVEQSKSRGTPKLEISADGIDTVDSGLIELPKMRAFTWQGVAMFLEVDVKTLRDYGRLDSHKDFHPVITRIDEVIYRQKYEGATSGFLNPNIIARDLGLADRKELEVVQLPSPIIEMPNE